jgi:hypothetical protein
MLPISHDIPHTNVILLEGGTKGSRALSDNAAARVRALAPAGRAASNSVTNVLRRPAPLNQVLVISDDRARAAVTIPPTQYMHVLERSAW